MKILLCLNRDIYCLLALNYLLPHIKNHQLSLYFSGGVGTMPNNKNLRNLRDCEQDLSMKNIKSIARKSEVEINSREFLSFEQIEQNFQILNFNNINKDGLEYLSQTWQPDLIISIRFGQIFQSPIIALPKFGIVNLHSGILPDYRGILATFWAMLNKETCAGITLHFIDDSSIDTGDIIAATQNKIDYKQSLIVNIFKLYPLGAEMIADLINQINLDVEIRTIKQSKTLGKYFSYPTDKDIENFLKFFTPKNLL